MQTAVYPHDLCALAFGVITCLKGAVLGTGSGREAVFVAFLLEPLVYLLPSDHACFVWLFDWQRICFHLVAFNCSLLVSLPPGGSLATCRSAASS